MKSYPTEYGGTMFRSRLEARFAAWFDLLGWPWDYEPFDCDGWIPDFRTGGLLWEVKPTPATCVEARAKIECANAPLPVVISCGPFWYAGELNLGECLYTRRRGGRARNFLGAWWWEPDPEQVDVDVQDLASTPSGGDLAIEVRSKAFEVAWRTAGNRVQWRAPRVKR